MDMEQNQGHNLLLVRCVEDKEELDLVKDFSLFNKPAHNVVVRENKFQAHVENVGEQAKNKLKEK